MSIITDCWSTTFFGHLLTLETLMYMSMYTMPAERSCFYEWKRIEKLNGTGTNLERMLNESKAEMGYTR